MLPLFSFKVWQMTKGLCFFDSAHKAVRSDVVCCGEQTHQRERPEHKTSHKLDFFFSSYGSYNKKHIVLNQQLQKDELNSFVLIYKSLFDVILNSTFLNFTLSLYLSANITS